MMLTAWLRNLMLPLAKIDAALPKKGLIYEIGCGMGVISNYLSQIESRRIVGIDTDLEKIEHDQPAETLSFVQADAATFSYQSCVGAVLSDFLHHVDYLTQEKILRRLTGKINKNGVLIVKEIDDGDGIRRWMSRFWDFIFYPQDKIYYRTKQDLWVLLKNLGYEVKLTREVIWFPGSTYFYICTKK